ncbi:unknown [[Mannheimia] succiniciproducens MBEL55E]|uniref:Uncharacterized protein n=1 Tax=Mannheimia succiniciproducens (strain KCTC 0769BP / MBEL55E) TaxID=221988 RepID=Q65UY3_MANSM|nr:unknown [[Mannheimia] succiniciproducens MBEL55E]
MYKNRRLTLIPHKNRKVRSKIRKFRLSGENHGNSTALW